MRLPIVVVCALAFGCGGSTGPTTTVGAGKVAHRVPTKSSDVRVEVTSRTININGIAVSGKPKLADMEAIFGKPDRTWDTGGANKVHTWDAIGILVYEPYDTDGTSGDGRCISLTFPYRPMSSSFSPKTMFAGTIQLDGKAFDPTLTLPGVLKWPGATQPYTKQSIVFDRGEFHVFTIEEKADAKAAPGIDLVEISFWQRGRDDEESRPARISVTDIDEDDCKNGDVPRCSNRALALQTGTAGRRNFERAFELVKTACAGGDVFGCLMLGNMHDAGKGTAQNKSEAKVAWKRACTLGYKPACELK